MFALKPRVSHAVIGGFAALSMASTASAIEPIPTQNGWDAWFALGVGYSEVESNFVAGTSVIDIGPEGADSLTSSPDSDDTAHPAINYEIKYTFGDQWQAFLGTSLQDQLTFDGVSQLGIRKQVSGWGIFQGGLLFSTLPQKTWQDPYRLDGRRDTDRSSQGVRLVWDKILDTGLEVVLQVREIEIDKERIGESQLGGLMPSGIILQDSDLALLERDGDDARLDIGYVFGFGPHQFKPVVRFQDRDRDGDTWSGDAITAVLTYGYVQDGFIFTGNVLFGEKEYDEVNPIYGIEQDSDYIALSANVLGDAPILGDDWQYFATAAWGEDDSDIDYHDTEAWTISAGLRFTF